MLGKLIVPLAALLLAIVTAYMARPWIEAKPEPVVVAAPPPPEPVYQEPDYIEVLVAAESIGVGTFLNQSAFRWQEWPDVDIPRSYFVRGQSDEEELSGAVVRQPILAGDPITNGNIVKPGERGFLAAVLEPGMRAISVPVDEASSNAGLILPGDRVDLILTQTIISEQNQRADRHVSETVLGDVRVIAMGRSLDGTTASQDTAQRQVRTTTLEVDPEGAQKVALITQLGRLSLSLRSLAKDENGEEGEKTTPRVWDFEVSSVRDEVNDVSELTVMRGRERELITIDQENEDTNNDN